MKLPKQKVLNQPNYGMWHHSLRWTVGSLFPGDHGGGGQSVHPTNSHLQNLFNQIIDEADIEGCHYLKKLFKCDIVCHVLCVSS